MQPQESCSFRLPRLTELSRAGAMVLDKVSLVTQVSEWKDGVKARYWYLATTATKLAQLKRYMQQADFTYGKLGQFGNVLAEGDGEPDEALKAYMAEHYGYRDSAEA